MQGWGWQSVHDPDVLPAVLERWKASIAQGEAFEMEFPLRGAVGRFRTFLTRGIPLKDSQGRVLRWFGTNTDISERKEMEESLRDSERRVRALMDSTAEAILGYDPQGNCTFCNPSALRLLGYEDSSELLGKNIHAIIHHSRPDGTPLAIQDCPLHRAAQAGQVFHADDLAYWRKDGACFSVECWSHPVFENGKAAGSVLTFFDITERKQAEERLAGQTEEVARQAEELARSEGALRAQTSLLQSVLDSLGEGLIVADQEGKFSLWNPAAWKILGSGPANISPEEWSQNYGIYLPDQITPFPTDQFPLLRAVRGESATAEMFIRNPGREQPAWIEVTGRPLKSDDGTVRGGVVAFRDITESKAAAEVIQKLNDELEQRVLQRTAELQAANQELQAFSYSVSHDLRAPLRHIGSFSKLLMEEFGPKLEPEAQHYLERITEGTRHMGQLVDELLNLARVGRHELSPQITGLNSIVQEVVTVLKPETEGRQVEWKIADLPFVECDPMLVKQVFQNLLANALKFTRPREQAVVEISQQEANGEPVLMVRDNGVGFSMKYADKLFGVFQRLHRSEDFEGTGVGLATVQRIVQKHGGRVWAEAELDHGATFYFTLGPAADKHMEAEHHTEAVGV
jgi:PAS domain S-box-containing protein